jgi:hypothetical protein
MCRDWKVSCILLCVLLLSVCAGQGRDARAARHLRGEQLVNVLPSCTSAAAAAAGRRDSQVSACGLQDSSCCRCTVGRPRYWVVSSQSAGTVAAAFCGCCFLRCPVVFQLWLYINVLAASAYGMYPCLSWAEHNSQLSHAFLLSLLSLTSAASLHNPAAQARVYWQVPMAQAPSGSSSRCSCLGRTGLHAPACSRASSTCTEPGSLTQQQQMGRGLR